MAELGDCSVVRGLVTSPGMALVLLVDTGGHRGVREVRERGERGERDEREMRERGERDGER